MRTECDSPDLAAANKVVTDQNTATAALHKVRDDLANAVTHQDDAMAAMRQLIIELRPSGVLTVDEIGAAIGRERNYVDSTWSGAEKTTTGKQTRIPVRDDVTDTERAAALASLTIANKVHANAAQDAKDARAERDRTVAMVYASKILGPSAIAAAVDVDRNHVLRIARKLGVKPVHRDFSRNQYSYAPGSTNKPAED